MNPHPLADLLPLLHGDDLDALAEDIRQHGLRVAITLLNGQVLDGRNQLAAPAKTRTAHPNQPDAQKQRPPR